MVVICARTSNADSSACLSFTVERRRCEFKGVHGLSNLFVASCSTFPNGGSSKSDIHPDGFGSWIGGHTNAIVCFPSQPTRTHIAFQTMSQNCIALD
jgi:hypothetical protein